MFQLRHKNMMRVAHTHTARNLLENPRSNTGTDKVDFVELCTGLTVICGGKHLDKACCAYNLYDVRGVRARSARTLVTSVKYHCITHEFENIFNRIPQILRVLLTIIIEYYKLLNSRFALEHRYMLVATSSCTSTLLR